MCLYIVTSTTRDRKREGFGWKVFGTMGGKLFGEFRGSGLREEGIWLKSKDDGSECYLLGFHIFHTRKMARKWRSWSFPNTRSEQRVRKVIWRDLLAEGLQGDSDLLRIIVAKEMMILA